MNPEARIRGLQRAIRAGQRRIRQIVTLNHRRRRRIKALRELRAPRFGVDYAFSRPSLAALRSDGVTFVCRYLSKDPGKNLTPSEAHELSRAGIDIVVVWETTAGRALDGFAAGVLDAKTALLEAQHIGMPAGRPIYFAIDFEAGHPETVEPYFRGVASVLGRGGTGAYGGIVPIAYLFDRGVIGFGWQTYAGSQGLWDHRAQLQQFSNDHSVGGASVDYDRSTQVDFGQWRV